MPLIVLAQLSKDGNEAEPGVIRCTLTWGSTSGGTIGNCSWTRRPITSAADSLQTRLFGRGAHGSMPQASIDPVMMAAAAVMRLQTVVSREAAAAEAAVVTVGALQAGTKENVIPRRKPS